MSWNMLKHTEETDVSQFKMRPPEFIVAIFLLFHCWFIKRLIWNLRDWGTICVLRIRHLQICMWIQAVVKTTIVKSKTRMSEITSRPSIKGSRQSQIRVQMKVSQAQDWKPSNPIQLCIAPVLRLCFQEGLTYFQILCMRKEKSKNKWQQIKTSQYRKRLATEPESHSPNIN